MDPEARLNSYSLVAAPLRPRACPVHRGAGLTNVSPTYLPYCGPAEWPVGGNIFNPHRAR